MKTSASEDPHLTVKETYPSLIRADFLEIKNDSKHNVIQAKYFEKQTIEILRKHPGESLNFLVDSTAIEEAKFVSKEARAILLRLYKHPQVGKVAFIGLTRWLSGMVRIFTQIAGRWDKTRFFKEEEEAIEWLREGKR